LSNNFSIEFYKDMCSQLSREKNTLEADKEHIKHDLSRLQTEIAGNTHSMRRLEGKIEELQKEKLQRTDHKSALSVTRVRSKVRRHVCRLRCCHLYQSIQYCVPLQLCVSGSHLGRDCHRVAGYLLARILYQSLGRGDSL
jgi:hypothetical protein